MLEAGDNVLSTKNNRIWTEIKDTEKSLKAMEVLGALESMTRQAATAVSTDLSLKTQSISKSLCICIVTKFWYHEFYLMNHTVYCHVLVCLLGMILQECMLPDLEWHLTVAARVTTLQLYDSETAVYWRW